MKDKLTELLEYAEDALQVFFGANLIVMLLSSGFLQFLWGLINTLQVLVLTALFEAEIPINALMVMRMILRMCSLDFIPPDYVLSFFKFRETRPFNSISSAKGDRNSNFEEAGYESSNFFELLGAILILAVLFVVFVIFRITVRVCCIPCGNNFCTRFFRRKIEFSLILLRFLLEGCIEIGISAMITIQLMDKDNFGSFWESVSTISAMISLVCLFIAPFALWVVIRRYLKHSEATKEPESSKWHNIFEEFKPKARPLRY